MTRGLIRVTAGLVVLAAVVGCGNGRKKVYPAQGEIYVNGKPQADVFIYLFPVGGDSDPKAVRPQGQTDATGTYHLSSYVQGDGAPEGEFVAIVEWPEKGGLMKTDFTGADRLKGAYNNIEKSKIKITINKGPTTIPRIDVEGPK